MGRKRQTTVLGADPTDNSLWGQKNVYRRLLSPTQMSRGRAQLPPRSLLLLLITLLPFPPRRTSRYRKGMILARPSYQGLRG